MFGLHLMCPLDLYSGNVAFALPDINEWSAERIKTEFGEPEIEPVIRHDAKPVGPEAPKYTVLPAYFWSLGIENITQEVRIIDFGEASLGSQYRTKLCTPLAYRAPESLFEEPITTKADVWSFACIVFDMFGVAPLLNVFEMDRDSLIAE